MLFFPGLGRPRFRGKKKSNKNQTNSGHYYRHWQSVRYNILFLTVSDSATGHHIQSLHAQASGENCIGKNTNLPDVSWYNLDKTKKRDLCYWSYTVFH